MDCMYCGAKVGHAHKDLCPRRPKPILRALRINGKWQLSVEIGTDILDFEWLVAHRDTWTAEELKNAGFEIAESGR